MDRPWVPGELFTIIVMLPVAIVVVSFTALALYVLVCLLFGSR